MLPVHPPGRKRNTKQQRKMETKKGTLVRSEIVRRVSVLAKIKSNVKLRPRGIFLWELLVSLASRWLLFQSQLCNFNALATRRSFLRDHIDNKCCTVVSCWCSYGNTFRIMPTISLKISYRDTLWGIFRESVICSTPMLATKISILVW